MPHPPTHTHPLLSILSILSLLPRPRKQSKFGGEELVRLTPRLPLPVVETIVKTSLAEARAVCAYCASLEQDVTPASVAAPDATQTQQRIQLPRPVPFPHVFPM